VPKGIFSISPLGTGERLVLADAGNPSVLPDGSLLVARVNAARQPPEYRYWPAAGSSTPCRRRVRWPPPPTRSSRRFPDGREAAFFGRPVAEQDSTGHLYAIDLTSRPDPAVGAGAQHPAVAIGDVSRMDNRSSSISRLATRIVW
jgi:hypothetical protein